MPNAGTSGDDSTTSRERVTLTRRKFVLASHRSMRMTDVAAEVFDGADATHTVSALELAPWRRAAEVVIGFVVFPVLLQPADSIVVLIAPGRCSGSAVRSTHPAGWRHRRPTRWFQPARPAAVVADAFAGTIERTQNGLVADRWRIGSTSVVIARAARSRVDRWRTLDDA